MRRNVQDFSIKNASLSTGSVAKRERLLQRNKILRRTGFIESETQMPGLKSGPEPSFPGENIEGSGDKLSDHVELRLDLAWRSEDFASLISS